MQCTKGGANKMINEIENHEGIAAKTQKTGFRKKAITTALIIAAVGMYTPTNAQQSTVGVNNGQPVSITQSGTSGIVNGTPAYTIPQGGSVAISLDGKTIVPISVSPQHIDNTPIQKNQIYKPIQNGEPVKYVPKSTASYETIKQDVETLLNNKAPLPDIRKKVASAERILNKEEKSRLYRLLGNKVQGQNDAEALFYYKKGANLGPEYKKSFSTIVQYLETKVK